LAVIVTQDADAGQIIIREGPGFIANPPIRDDCRYVLEELLAESRHRSA